MNKILDGKRVAEDVYTALPKMNGEELAIITIGHDDASERYVRSKIKACEKVGLKGHHYAFDPDCVTIDNLEEFIVALQMTENLAGIIVQRPYPEEFKGIEDFIQPGYDVDGLGFCNMGKTLSGQEPDFYPATPRGIIEILRYYDIPIAGKNVVIIGRSDIVGKPLAAMMLAENATVTVCHSKTQNLEEYTRRADIIVVAVGKLNFFDKTHITFEPPFCALDKEIKTSMPEKTIIDVGINRDKNGKLCGDVDIEGVLPYVSHITPVPGGVGPMTVAMLIQNAVTAVLRKRLENQSK